MSTPRMIIWGRYSGRIDIALDIHIADVLGTLTGVSRSQIKM